MKDNVKGFFKDNWKYLFASLFILVVVIFSVNWIVCQRQDYGSLDVLSFYKKVMIFSVIVWILFSVGAWFFFKKNLRIEFIFLFFYVLFGIGYLTVYPFSTIPDEEAHFVRIYGITEGHLLAEVNEEGIGGAYVADNILDGWNYKETRLDDIKSWSDREVGDSETFYEAANTALYSPLSYLPQTIGLGIGKILSDNVVFMLYMTRIVSWLVVGALLFFAIRITPMGKGLLMFISLLPMNMQECASFAADGWTYGIVTFFVAYILYLRYSLNRPMDTKQYVLLYGLLILLTSCKIVYVPLCLLAFFIPVDRFGGKKNFIKNAVIAGITVLVFTVGWLAISSSYLIEFNEGVDSGQQVSFILHNIPGYIKILFNTIMSSIEVYIKTLFGWKLGHLTVEVNNVMVYTTLFIIVLVAAKEKIRVKDEFFDLFRYGLLGICGIVTLILFTSLYVQWSPVGIDNVRGVQGRYFIPLLFAFIIGCKKACPVLEGGAKNDIYDYKDIRYEMLFLAYVHINALISVYCYYIV